MASPSLRARGEGEQAAWSRRTPRTEGKWAWLRSLARPRRPFEFGQVTEIVGVSASSSVKRAWVIIRPNNSYLAA